MHWAAVVAGSCLLAACTDGEQIVDGKVQLSLGERCYRIPLWNAELIHASPFPGISQPVSNRTLRLQFSTAELEQAIPGFRVPHDVYGRPRKDALVSVFWRTPAEIARDDRNSQNMHYDIWYGLGDYSARVIEPIPGTSFWRIYPIAGGTWMVVTKRPDEQRRDTHLDKDFWIATCSRMHIQGAESSCISSVEAGELTGTFYTTEANLSVRNQMMEYVLMKLDEWRAPCK
ncbi:MAG: hypothetical protein IRZ28_07615 [Steroidobacteraceae bacterium]|nr:hypothetical protein [Steroidobacteraceae bacterium]